MREAFKVRQVELRQAGSLAYVLLEQAATPGESMVFIWHFKRESVLLTLSPKASLARLAVLGAEKLLGVGRGVCRAYLLDF